jgi:hypothetical protein
LPMPFYVWQRNHFFPPGQKHLYKNASCC